MHTRQIFSPYSQFLTEFQIGPRPNFRRPQHFTLSSSLESDEGHHHHSKSASICRMDPDKRFGVGGLERLNYRPQDEFLSRISAEERIGWAKPDYKVTISDIELKADLPKWVRGEKQVELLI